jgi:hypothetical protein
MTTLTLFPMISILLILTFDGMNTATTSIMLGIAFVMSLIIDVLSTIHDNKRTTR